jgi:hypothetical protein
LVQKFIVWRKSEPPNSSVEVSLVIDAAKSAADLDVIGLYADGIENEEIVEKAGKA